jgi:hypothetical protein
MPITNEVASQALRGQNVKVTLTTSDANNLLPTLQIGTEVQEDAFSTIGYVYSVDLYGNSFEVIPTQPDKVFGGEGYLPATTIINIATP